MRAIALQSGSNGNCVYVETGKVRLLLDAGISGKRAAERLDEFGRDIRDVDAVLISHDHADHVRCAGIYQRKFGLPVYVTAPTLAAAQARCSLGTLDDVRHFTAGETLQFDGATVETMPTPHDGVDGVAFLVDDGHKRLGVLTDLGHVFNDLGDAVASLDAVLLESNYDVEMLRTGSYPAFLKRRIRGPGGHISNVEAAELLDGVAGAKLRWACLAHLSQENNRPDLALQTHYDIVGDRFALYAASRHKAVELPAL